MPVINLSRWWLLALAFVMTLAVSWDAAVAMVTLWLTTDTYMHGSVVIPLALILAKNQSSPEYEPQPLRADVSFILTTLWCGGLLLGKLAMLNVIQQIMIIGFIPLSILLCYGWRFTRHYIAPLSLIFLAVPFGDFMIPFLQSITADMAVFLLQVSDVAVLRNGWYISITSANFRVAEACSGINFLISTFTISAFYAFFYMEKYSKRILFMLLGILVPIIANGLRVYLIIMIAEWGNVEAATGFDHLVYGWIFFVVVLIALFFIGSWMQDPAPSKTESGLLVDARPLTLNQSNRLLFIFGFLVVLLATMLFINTQQSQSAPHASQLKEAQAPDDLLGPEFPNADSVSHQTLDDWMVYEIIYHNENTNKKMIGYQNRWFDGKVWSLEQSSRTTIASEPFNRWILADVGGRRYQLVFSYCIGGQWQARRLSAKMHQALGKLFGTDFGGRAYAWFAPEDKSISDTVRQQTARFCKN